MSIDNTVGNGREARTETEAANDIDDQSEAAYLRRAADIVDRKERELARLRAENETLEQKLVAVDDEIGHLKAEQERAAEEREATNDRLGSVRERTEENSTRICRTSRKIDDASSDIHQHVDDEIEGVDERVGDLEAWRTALREVVANNDR